MMTYKQERFLNSLITKLEEKDAEKYDVVWKLGNLNYACNDYSVYRTSKFQASKDIETCLSELNK